MSRPDSLDEDAGLRREELLAGVPLVRALDTVAGPDGVEPLAADLAGQVAALHALDPGRDLAGLPLADHTGPVAFARWHRKTLRTIGRALPALAPRAAAVVDGLAGSVPAPADGVVHGDLHAANVHVGPEGAVLLDLDELGRGDRELDVAVLVGRLLLVSDSAGRTDTTALARAFVAAHDASGAVPLRGDVLAWYLAGTLVGRQVKTSIRHLAPDLEALCTRLVGLAEVAFAVHRDAGPGTSAAEVVDRLAGAVLPVTAPA
jgi:aminoglycoside phosphotransferase (APT) family kinase protein